jgi:two-component system sensor histidine kinase KdpD
MGDRTVSGEVFQESIFALSRLVTTAEDAAIVLPTLVEITRKLLIFDNFVIYLKEDGDLRPYFARSVGRGRSKEADVAWGEEVVDRIYEEGELILQKERVGQPELDRLNDRFYIGAPLRQGNRSVGVIILIRFGGPPFKDQDREVFQFVADHIAHLLEREHLVNTLRKVEGSQRMWKMQENFVATVSHDLRTPLGFIKGYTTTLLREDTEWEIPTYREFLGIIDDEADRLQELIDNLLDSSRLQSGTLPMNLQNVQLDVLLRDMVQRSKLSDLEIRVELEILNQEVMVRADPMRLGQVFDNLLNNASKYAPGSRVLVQLFEEDSQAVIVVEDDGPGIGAEHLEKIFQRFYRVPETKMSKRGSGLGLYICRQIIAAHRGQITAESEEGEGAAFTITLPLLDEHRVESPEV